MENNMQNKVLKQLNIIAAVVCFSFFSYLFFHLDDKISAMYFLITAFAYSFNYWLIGQASTRLIAMLSIFFSDVLVMLFDTGFTTDMSNAPVLYIPLLLFSYVVTDYKDRKTRFAMIAFTLACLAVINFTDLTPKLGEMYQTPQMLPALRLLNIGVAVITSLLILRIITRTNHIMKKELIAAKNLAEKSLKEKNRFLSVMSHEIRTPANVMVGISHLMMEKIVPEDMKRDIRLLNHSAHNLKYIIDNVLYYTSLEVGKEDLNLKPFDIRKLCLNTVDSAMLDASRKNVELHFDFDDRVPQFLTGDVEKLTQVLSNLLSNAIKFTKNGDIFLWVKMNHSDDSKCYLYFKVADTGVGIESTRIKEVFQEFNQATSGITRDYDGMGLGLSISRKLLKLMGSDVHLTSEPGVGTTVHFEIALALASDVKDEEQRFIEAHDLGKLSVLLVEDNKLNVLVAKKILNGMNAEVDVAADGSEAISKTLTKKYGIILMDIHMPVMDGFEATRRIREKDSEIPILAFTADVFEDTRIKAREAGMDDFITKPFDPVILYDKINANLKRSTYRGDNGA